MRTSLVRVALAVVTGVAAPLAIGVSSASAKTTGEPLKVMVIYEGTSNSGIIVHPEFPEVAIVPSKALNKKDGVGNRPTKIIKCDTGNDPNRAAQCGQRAVSESVAAVLAVSLHAQTSRYRIAL